jgi:hypothetical protein
LAAFEQVSGCVRKAGWKIKCSFLQTLVSPEFFTIGLHFHDNWLTLRPYCLPGTTDLRFHQGAGTTMKNSSLFAAAALAIAAFALTSTTAVAQSYTGNFPMTDHNKTFGKHTYCLELTDDGSVGFAHSGPATLVEQTGSLPGYFQVVNNLLMAEFDSEGGTVLTALVFVVPASNGNIASKGVDNLIPGEGGVLTSTLAVGKKGGCGGSE